MATPADRLAGEIINHRKLLLWIGAGTSRSAGLRIDSPGNNGIAHQLALIHYEDSEDRVRQELGDEFRLADLARHLGKPRVRDLIIQLGWNALRGSAAHRAIAALAAEGFRIEIVTINYDPLLERELKELNINSEVISAAATVRILAEDIVAVVKVHGCPFSDRNIDNILMLEGELRVPPGWVTTFLNGRLQERIFVYSGFSGSVPYVLDSIRMTRDNLQGHVNSAYAVDVEPIESVYVAGNPLGQFYKGSNVDRENYSGQGADEFFAELATAVFRIALLRSVEEALPEARRHGQIDAVPLKQIIGRMNYEALVAFARRVGVLTRGTRFRVQDTRLRSAFKWMLLLSALGIVETASYRPVFAFPFHPGPNGCASAPVIILDGGGREVSLCRDEVHALAGTPAFRDEFQLRTLSKWFAVIINSPGVLDRVSLDIIQRESDSTVHGYDSVVCVEENTLLGQMERIREVFAT